MPGRGPTPKPAHLRQRANKKLTATVVHPAEDSVEVPAIPNPDGREWHPLTVEWWNELWRSGLPAAWHGVERRFGAGLIATALDNLYKHPEEVRWFAEYRQHVALFALDPAARERLQVTFGEPEAGESSARREGPNRTGTHDPRHAIRAVK